jgi:VCBS repeat-containing protein
VSATDPERDAVTFAGSGVTGKGSVIVDAAGGFVYTPSDEARHRAGADDATQADKQDTFTVTAVDFYGAKLAVPVTVTIVGLTAL